MQVTSNYLIYNLSIYFYITEIKKSLMLWELPPVDLKLKIALYMRINL